MVDTEKVRPLVRQCGDAMARLATMVPPKDSEWLELEMSMGQLKAVMVLSCSGPLTVGGLAKALDLAEPSASILVDKLEKRGLASRETDPSDRRRTPVVVTSAGQDLVTRLRHVRDEQLTIWLSELDDTGLSALFEGVTALVQVIEKSGSGAPCDEPAKGRD